MNILAVSDIELGYIYNVQIAQRFEAVDLVVSCGDLPYYYLEFIISMLDKPLYYVRGNHQGKIERGVGGERTYPWGAIDLHNRVIRNQHGLLLAGIEGSLRYNLGPHQYTQTEMWTNVFSLIPALLYNRLRYGRYLDLFVTHAPPWKIHDMDDLPHQGIKAFRWLIKVFKPTYHLHGHIHIYRNGTIRETAVGETRIVNCYGYRELAIMPSVDRKASLIQKQQLSEDSIVSHK